jgi:RimJ/RimL family protein N-acetyltransferase
MLDHVAHFRQLGTLSDGTRVLLRPLQHEDTDALLALFGNISAEDLQFVRSDITNKATVRSWVDDLDYHRVLPLMAVVNDRFVGDATLHFRTGPHRHVAEIRIFLLQEYRRRGLGNLMLKTLVDIARKAGIQFIIAQVVADQTRVVQAFHSLGFERKAVLEDFFLMPNGDAHDVIYMVLSLRAKKEEF